MGANLDKVEEKTAKEIRDKIKAGMESSEIKKELDSHDVGYKIKNGAEM